MYRKLERFSAAGASSTPTATTTTASFLGHVGTLEIAVAVRAVGAATRLVVRVPSTATSLFLGLGLVAGLPLGGGFALGHALLRGVAVAAVRVRAQGALRVVAAGAVGAD